MILGGSQGAEIFGEIIPPAIKMAKDKGYEIEVNQQCLEKQKKKISEYYDKYEIKNNIFIFSNNLINLISSTDLAISRCGASTTAELVHTCTPFIAIPYPHSMDNHQDLNAKFYENKGYCWLLREVNFNSSTLFSLIEKIIKDKKNLVNIRENMKKNDNKNVYTNIENAIREFI